MATRVPDSQPDGGGGAHPPAPAPESHHRNVQGGTARAAVFGISDGLVSNIGLIIGVAGAGPAPSVVRLAGLAGLVSGAVSMAAGEYVSMKAQSELLARELEMERIELDRSPDREKRELAQIYRSRGVSAAVADSLAAEMMANPELALETHAREELGIDPNELGSPVGAALSSFAAFSGGALIPLVPWFFARGGVAVGASLALAAAAAILVGVALARFTGRPWVRVAARQLCIAVIAAGVTYVIGNAVGVTSVT